MTLNIDFSNNFDRKSPAFEILIRFISTFSVKSDNYNLKSTKISPNDKLQSF